jgi:prepilin-type N-terminal cleavage/methylation domain-containing protein
MKQNRGFTLIELLVVMAIIALLIGLLLPALAKARATAKLTKDASQIRGIHQSWLTYARQNNGIFPTPGLAKRLQDPVLGFVPGRGPENELMNDTARLHSLCMMNNFYTPEFAIGTTEPSGFVAVKDNYNYSLYNPTAPNGGVYWDDSFESSLDPAQGAVSNISYASMPIAGGRKPRQWRDTIDSAYPILGNRGVRDGDISDSEAQGSYKKSITLEIHGGRKEWYGNICFQDNRVVQLGTFYPEGVKYLNPTTGQQTDDNIFKNDFPGGTNLAHANASDAYLVIVRKGGIQQAGGVTAMATQWD